MSTVCVCAWTRVYGESSYYCDYEYLVCGLDSCVKEVSITLFMREGTAPRTWPFNPRPARPRLTISCGGAMQRYNEEPLAPSAKTEIV